MQELTQRVNNKRDKEGRVSTAHVMNLINTKGIDDPDWNDAIQAIRDCMSVQSTKAYNQYVSHG